MAKDVAETTESLPKVAGLVGLDRPLDQLDLTKMLAESFEPEEQEGSEETSPSGDAVEEPSRLRNRPRRRGTPNTFFHRRNRKRNPMLNGWPSGKLPSKKSVSHATIVGGAK